MEWSVVKPEDEARIHQERTKARRLGYELDDVFWYTPGLVEQLIPMAAKPDWKPTDETLDQNGKPGRSKPAREGGDLLAMVMDVRRAAKAVGWNPNAIVDYLGGRRPKGLTA